MKVLIVESPAKAKKIQSFYKNDIKVISSCGHINNLDPKKLDMMINDNFNPIYINSDSKNKIISQLKKYKKEEIILAADDDREGDAIAWHVGNLYKLNYNNNNRIIFNEISKKALDKSLNNIIKLNINSVNAQRARQLIDLIIGYKLSPLLWKHIKTDTKGLSAGRVQSCLLNIINMKNIEIEKNLKNPKYSHNLTGNFNNNDTDIVFDFVFSDKDITVDLIKDICNILIENKKFNVDKLNTKKEKKYSPSPFRTSTLQQTAQQELGFSVKMTMNIAQKLYDNGLITYHRTDNTFISDDFKEKLKTNIKENYGNNYYENKKEKSVKGSQEAHEAIRVTDLEKILTVDQNNINYTEVDHKLYNLIKKRTIISHMKPAIYDVIIIELSNNLMDKFGYFKSKIKSLYFDGYLKYDNKEKEIIDLDIYKDIKEYNLVSCIYKYKIVEPPQLYTEATIVKELERSGVGRPSTYASLIDTLYNRKYIVSKDIPENKKLATIIKLNENNILEEIEEEYTISKQKNKIIITDLGILVLEYLSKYFENIINPVYTSEIENDLDKITKGEVEWIGIIKKVYDSFISIVIEQMGNIKTQCTSGIVIGKIKNKEIKLLNGPYGYYINYNNKNKNIKSYLEWKKKEKDDLTIEDCKTIVKYPKKIGTHNKKSINICIGKYGYYMEYNKKFYKIPQDENKWDLELLKRKIKV